VSEPTWDGLESDLSNSFFDSFDQVRIMIHKLLIAPKGTGLLKDGS